MHNLLDHDSERNFLLFGAIALLLGGVVGALTGLAPIPLLPLVGLVGLIGVATCFVRPELGLYALVFMIYIRLSDVLVNVHGLPSVAKPFIGFLVGVIIVRAVLYGERPQLNRPGTYAMLSYALLALISILVAGEPGRSVEALSDFFKDVAIALIVFALLTNADRLRWVIWSFVLVGLCLGTIATIQQATGTLDYDYFGFGQAKIAQITEDLDDAPRISGPGLDPNGFAQIMLFLFPLAVYLVRFERGIFRLAAGWAVVVILLTILFTFSRSAFLVLVGTCGLMLWQKPPKVWMVFAALSVAVLLLPFVPAEYTARIATLTDLLPTSGTDITSEVSFSGRLSENISAVLMFRDHPVFGVGIGNYNARYQEYSRTLGLDERREERSPHSMYLEIASESGLVGLIWFGLLQWVTFGGLYRAKLRFEAAGRDDLAQLCWGFAFGLISYLMMGVFLHLYEMRYFWLIYGVGLAFPYVAQACESVTSVVPNRL